MKFGGLVLLAAAATSLPTEENACIEGDVHAMGPPHKNHYHWDVEHFEAKIYSGEHEHENKHWDSDSYEYKFKVKGKHFKDCNFNIPALNGWCEGKQSGRPESDWKECKLKGEHHDDDGDDDDDDDDDEHHDWKHHKESKLYAKVWPKEKKHHRKGGHDEDGHEDGHCDEAKFSLSYTFWHDWHRQWIHWNYTGSFDEEYQHHDHCEPKDFEVFPTKAEELHWEEPKHPKKKPGHNEDED